MTEATNQPLNVYLQRMVDTEASDVFLSAGEAPTYRISGDLVQVDLPAPSEADMQAYVAELLTPVARQRFEQSPDIDVAHTIENVGRFRINLYMQQGRLALVARLIPTAKLDFDLLGLPHVIRDMVDKRRGLILVVGPTGCGKSTTLASLIHHINATRSDHIVTIEDPIEFIHEPQRCLIHQRQVGYDTESFATALRHIVRQSPDVILIGEMRDRDTMETAINAAMTGHLVLSTMHTTSVVQSIDRMLNYFPPDARRQAQADLAATLVGLVAMRLLPRKDGKGRCPAVEVLRGTPTARRLITEGDFVELYDLIKRSRDAGMMTLNQSLVELTKAGTIDANDAVAHAPNPDEFRLNMEGMFTGTDSIDLRGGQ